MQNSSDNTTKKRERDTSGTTKEDNLDSFASSAKKSKLAETPSQPQAYTPYDPNIQYSAIPNYPQYPQPPYHQVAAYPPPYNQYYGQPDPYGNYGKPAAGVSMPYPPQTSIHQAYSTYQPKVAGSVDNNPQPLMYPVGVDPLAAPKTEDKTVEQKPKLRKAAGQVWVDPTLDEWPENDFRIYVGNLGNEVDDEMLHKAFVKYPSLAKWRVVLDNKFGFSRGFGFVSFLDPREGVRALKEMNGKHIGQRPCKLTKSTWDRRNFEPPQKQKR